MAERNGDTGLGAAAGRVADHARRLVSLELELARAELKRKVGSIALGIGLAVGAAVFGLLGIALLVATAAAALTLVLPVWAAILVVGGAALLIAGVLALVGMRALRRGTPPVPEQAIHEARMTSEALKGNSPTSG
jgi:hypothetical protein